MQLTCYYYMNYFYSEKRMVYAVYKDVVNRLIILKVL